MVPPRARTNSRAMYLPWTANHSSLTGILGLRRRSPGRFASGRGAGDNDDSFGSAALVTSALVTSALVRRLAVIGCSAAASTGASAGCGASSDRSGSGGSIGEISIVGDGGPKSAGDAAKLGLDNSVATGSFDLVDSGGN